MMISDPYKKNWGEKKELVNSKRAKNLGIYDR